MKKYSVFFGLAALVMGLTACDDVEDSNSLPQVNPQLPGVELSNLQVTPAPGITSGYNLNDAEGSSVAIATVPTPTDWPEGFTVDVPYIEVDKTADFADPQHVEAKVSEAGEVTVSKDDLNGAFVELFGNTARQRTGYIRFAVYAVNGTQSVRMGNENTWFINSPVELTPADAFGGLVLEDNYYVVGSFCGWDVTKGIKMQRNGEETDPYLNPVFQAVIKAPAETEFAIVAESSVSAGSYLTNAYSSFGGEYEGITDTKGHLLPNEVGQQANPILLPDAGGYQITVNMVDLSYTILPAIEQLYTPGDSNGWNQAASQTLHTDNYTWYQGYAHLTGAFKFTTRIDWNGTNYGEGGKDADTGHILLSTDGGDINAPADALYWVTVDLGAEKPYCNLTEITRVGVIGDATPTGWDGDTALTPSADFLTWTGTMTLGTGNFKFRMNDDWDINLGGETTNLTQGGADIPSPGAGTYVITLNVGTYPYTCTLTAQ